MRDQKMPTMILAERVAGPNDGDIRRNAEKPLYYAVAARGVPLLVITAKVVTLVRAALESGPWPRSKPSI